MVGLVAHGKTRMSSKGQIVLPKELREQMGWAAGDRIDIEANERSLVLRRDEPDRVDPDVAARAVDELQGLFAGLRRGKPPLSIDEMTDAAAQGAAARHAQKKTRRR